MNSYVGSVKLDTHAWFDYTWIRLDTEWYDFLGAVMHDRWMTHQEVSECLKLSKDRIYRLAQTGSIPAWKVGNRWRFRRDRIDSWMENMSVGGETGARK